MLVWNLEPSVLTALLNDRTIDDSAKQHRLLEPVTFRCFPIRMTSVVGGRAHPCGVEAAPDLIDAQ